MTKVYGIKNCDTVKKALKWLDANGFAPQLHDYRKDGLNSDWLQAMAAQFGWEALLNKKSTTWRNLDEAQKTDLDEAKALALLNAQPTLIKRPIVICQEVHLIGFNEAEYHEKLTACQGGN